MRSEFKAHLKKFLAGIDRPENLAPDFLRCLDLAADLVGPVVWNVAIGTGGAHAGAVGVVNRRFQLCKDIVSHLVAADAELFSVCRFERGVEATPEDDAGEEASDGEKPEAQRLAR